MRAYMMDICCVYIICITCVILYIYMLYIYIIYHCMYYVIYRIYSIPFALCTIYPCIYIYIYMDISTGPYSCPTYNHVYVYISHIYLIALFNPLALFIHVSTESHVGWGLHSCHGRITALAYITPNVCVCLREAYLCTSTPYTQYDHVLVCSRHIYVHKTICLFYITILVVSPPI